MVGSSRRPTSFVSTILAFILVVGLQPATSMAQSTDAEDRANEGVELAEPQQPPAPLSEASRIPVVAEGSEVDSTLKPIEISVESSQRAEVPEGAELTRSEGGANFDVYTLGEGAGTHVAIVHPTDVNREDPDGEWRDLKLAEEAGGWRGVTGEKSSASATFPTQLGAVEWASGDGRLSIAPEDVDPVDGKADGLQVVYADARKATDFVYALDGSGYKETVVLRSPDAPRSFSWLLSGDDLAFEPQDDGSLLVSSSAAGTVGYLSAPYVIDAKGQVTLGTYRVEAIDAKDATHRVSLTVDDAFLDLAAYPVLVDPGVHDNGDNPLEASRDTYTNASNASTSYESATRLHVGNGPTRHSFLRFDVTDLMKDDRLVYDATMALSVDVGSGGNIAAHRVTDTWPSSVTFNNQPAVGIEIDAQQTVDGTWATWQMKELYQHIIQTNYAGHWPNQGQRLSKASGTDDWQFYSTEAFSGTSQDPLLVVQWNDLPGNPALSTPDANAVIESTSPTLKINAIPNDSNGDKVYTQFQISDDGTNWSGAHLVYESGWLKQQKSHVVPSGLLLDGERYYWRARAWDGLELTDGAGVQRQEPVSGVKSFTVALKHHGSDSRWAIWSRPIGNDMSISVNQANGNLVLDVPISSLTTPVGYLALEASFNSQQSADHGLTPGWDLAVGPSQVRAELPIELVKVNPQPDGGVKIRMRGGRTLFFPHADGRTYEAEGAGAGQVRRADDGGFIYDAPDGGRFVFRSNGTLEKAKPVWASDAGGADDTYDYVFSSHAGEQRLDRVTDPLGRHVDFEWNTQTPPHLIGIETWDGREWTFANPSGLLSSITNPAGEVVEFVYNTSNGRLIEVRDGRQAPTDLPGWKFAHAVESGDTSGTVRVASITPPGASAPDQWTFDYPGPYRATTSAQAVVVDPRGNASGTANDFTTITDFNWAGLPIRVAGPADQTGYWPISTTVWDSNGNVICRRSPMANAFAEGAVAQGGTSDANQPCRSEALTTVYDYEKQAPYLMTKITHPAPDTAGTGSRQVEQFAYDEGFQGLWAEMFGNATASGLPVGERVWSSGIDEHWGASSPTEIGPDDTWAVRWTGYLDLTDKVNERDYEFKIASNDGVALTIGDRTLFDCFGDAQSASSVNCGSGEAEEVTLWPGLKPITIEFSELTDSASIEVRWDQGTNEPGEGWQIIPLNRLLPARHLLTSKTTTVDTGLTQEATYGYASNDAKRRRLPTSEVVGSSAGADERTIDYTYNDYGQVKTITTPVSTTVNDYDNGQASWTGSSLVVSCLRTSTLKEPGGAVVSKSVNECNKAGAVTKNTVEVPAVAGTIQDTSTDRITSTTYDGVGRILTVDHHGNGVTSSGVQAPDVEYVYDDAGNKVLERAVVDGTQVIETTFDYDAVGNLETLTAPDPDAPGSGGTPAVTEFTYDWTGNQLTVSDPRNSTWITTTTYDAMDRVIQVQGPDPDAGGSAVGLITSTVRRLRTGSTYDNEVVVTDPAGVSATQTLDVLGRVTHESIGTLAPTTFLYSRGGLLTRVTGPDPDGGGTLTGVRTDIAYNAHGQETLVTSFAGTADAATTEKTYDAGGRLEEVDGPRGVDDRTLYDYDAAGHPVAVTQPGVIVPGTGTPGDPVTTEITYSAAGERVEMTTPLDHNTDFTRGWAYDPVGRLAEFTDARGTTTHTYNDAGWLVSTDDPRSGTLQFVYDNLGRLKERRQGTSIDREAFTYDKLGNELTAKTYASDGTTLTSTVEMTYDYLSRLDTVTAGADTTTYAFDAASGVLDSVDDAAGLTSYAYDANGLLDTIDDPITTGLIDYGYDQAGRVLTRTDTGSGSPAIVWTRAYEANTGRVDTQSIKKGTTTLVSSDLTYDAASNVTNRAQTVDGVADSWSYDYDAIGQMTSATLSGGSATTYKYDGGGNRYWVKEGSATPVVTEYDAASLPVSSDDGTTYETDALGNLLEIDPTGTSADWTFSYDAWSRMRTAQQGSSTPIEYLLDGLSRTKSRTVGTSETSYLYRGTSEEQSKVIDSSVTTTYSYSAGGPLAQQQGTTKRLFLRDLHGDVLGLTSTTGTVQGSRTFDPWGEVRTSTGETASIGFQGDPTDPDAGLVDMLTRSYVPSLGRFTTRDVLFGDPMQPPSLNQFIYSHGNPATWADPTGMCANAAYCPAPPGSSAAEADAWYSHGEEIRDAQSVDYDSYATAYYVSNPEKRPPEYRPEFFNRMVNLTLDRGWMDLGHADFKCSYVVGTGKRCGVVSERVDWHLVADGVGVIPVVGDFVDFGHALYYAATGDWKNAGLTAIAIVPIVGSPGKLGLKYGPDAAKVMDDALDLTPKLGSTVGPGGTRYIPAGVRREEALASGGRCRFCGVQTTSQPGPTRREWDHAIPFARGGDNSIDNIQTTCRLDNRRKGCMTSFEYIDWLSNRRSGM